MPGLEERRREARHRSSARILWTTLGNHELQIDRLTDVSGSGARVATDAVARVGQEIRFDLLDEDGEKLATGLAKVVWVDASRGMGIAFLSLGVDEGIVRSLATVERDPFASAEGPKKRPPALPGKVGGPPPMPGEHVLAERAAASRKAPHDSLERDPFKPGSDLSTEEEESLPEIEPLAIRRDGVIIGIDLGTTTTCASYVVDGKPKIIPGRTGTNTIPSMITFDPDGTFYVGQRAADRQILYPLRTVYGSKRLVGRTYRAELAAELQQHFAYPLGEAEGQRFGVRLDDRVISMDTIAARVLDEVRSTAEAHLGKPVEAAVITVPAYFSEVQREAVRRAAKEANLVVHRIVNEPTAAAVAYGHKQKGLRARIAVWDFGGGTFDFSILDVQDGQLEVVTTGGDNFVGGSDFDDLLASHLLGEFQSATGIDFEPSAQQVARLREAAEIAKRALSVQTEYTVELPEFTRDPIRALSVHVKRDRFEELTRSLVDRSVAIAREVMEGGSVAPEGIDDVILVGGTTRIPAVQAAVAELFGRRPSKRINPDEAVALGAALLADEIGSGSAPTLLDVLPMSVGHGAPGLKFVPLVSKNSRLPAQTEVTLPADVLGSVTLPLFQGESSDVSKNEYLCSAIVEDRSLWENGRVLLRLSFDEHCVMAVDARNAKTGRPLPTRLERGRPVEEILRELGHYEGPKEPEWQRPQSRLGTVLGRLFKVLGR